MPGGGPVPNDEDIESLRRNKEIKNKRILANIVLISCQVLLIVVTMNTHESARTLLMGTHFLSPSITHPFEEYYVGN